MTQRLPDLDYVRSILEYRDGMLFHKVNRGKAKKGNRAGNTCNMYRSLAINKVAYYEHRMIFYIQHGWCPEYIDHINGNKQDNRIENLRPATAEQNTHNSAAKKNISGAKGITFDKRYGVWYARLRYNGIRKCLGCFKSLDLAKEFIELAREMVHGEYANHGKAV